MYQGSLEDDCRGFAIFNITLIDLIGVGSVSETDFNAQQEYPIADCTSPMVGREGEGLRAFS